MSLEPISNPWSVHSELDVLPRAVIDHVLRFHFGWLFEISLPLLCKRENDREFKKRKSQMELTQ